MNNNNHPPKERIDRFLAGIKEAQALMIAGSFNNKENIRIAEKYKLGFGWMAACLNSGIFNKISPGEYAPAIKLIEPIHAVRVITELKDMASKASKERYARQKEIKEKSVRIPAPQPKQKIVEVRKKQKKEFSFLWGLFKFTY